MTKNSKTVVLVVIKEAKITVEDWIIALHCHIHYADTGSFPTDIPQIISQTAPNPILTIPTPQVTSPSATTNSNPSYTVPVAPVYSAYVAPTQDTSSADAGSPFSYTAGPIANLVPIAPAPADLSPAPPSVTYPTLPPLITTVPNPVNTAHHSTYHTSTPHPTPSQPPDLNHNSTGWFTHYDTNNDGFLSKETVARGLKDTYPSLTSSHIFTIINSIWEEYCEKDHTTEKVSKQAFVKSGGLAEMIVYQLPSDMSYTSPHSVPSSGPSTGHLAGSPGTSSTYASQLYPVSQQPYSVAYPTQYTSAQYSNTQYANPTSYTTAPTPVLHSHSFRTHNTTHHSNLSGKSPYNSLPSAAMPTPHNSDPSQPLPPNWDEMRTDEGRVYYVNLVTRQTAWERPAT